MRFIGLILFAILEIVISGLGIFIAHDISGIIALPVILLGVAIILKVTDQKEAYSELRRLLLWGSVIAITLLLPFAIMVGKIQC